MKKYSVILLTFILLLSINCIVFAGPFTDVPSSHWSYEAVSKLVKAGIIEGYGDGSFNGNKTMTRYEMAMIVGKALEHEDQANVQNKALIEKLATEYAAELSNLGVRVRKLEDYNKTNLKVSFDSLTIISSDSPSNNQPKVRGNDMFRMRDRIYFNGSIDPSMSYGLRVAANVNMAGANNTSTATFFDQGYMENLNFLGFDSVRWGRMSILEQGGMVLFRDGGNDGIRLTKKMGNDTTIRLGAYVTNPDPGTSPNIDYGNSQEIQYISLQQKLDGGITVGAAALNNNRSVAASTTAFNYGYAGSRLYDLYGSAKLGNWTLTGEYSVNRLFNPTGNVNSNPHAYEVQLTNGTNMPNVFYPAMKIYADVKKPGSNAFAVSYRYAQTGAIPANLGNAKQLWWVSPDFKVNGKAYDGIDNTKTWYVGYQYVLAKGLGLSLDYQDYRLTSTGASLDKTYYAIIWFLM